MDRITVRDTSRPANLAAGCRRIAAAEEMAALADRVPAIVTREPPGSVLVVADFSDAEFTAKQWSISRSLRRSTGLMSSARPGCSTENLAESTVTIPSADFPPASFPSFATREEAMDYIAGE